MKSPVNPARFIIADKQPFDPYGKLTRWQINQLLPDMYQKLPLSLRKALYPLQLKIRAIRQRRLDKITSSAMTRAVDIVASREPPIRKHMFYGASAINPKHLVTWYIFQTDRELEAARQNGLTLDLETITRSELLKHGYPEKGAGLMHVSFTSEEDVQDKTGGCTPRDYFYYFK